MRKAFVAMTLAICFSGLSISTGCTERGQVVDGKADNNSFGESVDGEPRDGLGVVK